MMNVKGCVCVVCVFLSQCPLPFAPRSQGLLALSPSPLRTLMLVVFRDDHYFCLPPLWVSVMCVCVFLVPRYFSVASVIVRMHHKSSNRFHTHTDTTRTRVKKKGLVGVANNHIKQGEKSREKRGRHLDEGG